MAELVPSYIAKVARAEKHLIELKEAIKEFAAPHPYVVTTTTIQGKKQRKDRRLTFTSDPANTDIPVIAADVIYNLRSALDHLMAALVASQERTHVYFPIYFNGVWEPEIEGENEQRRRERHRWATDITTVDDKAVAILKKLQPPDRREPGQDNLLRILNALSNTDRHVKLPVAAEGLRAVVVQWKLPSGQIQRGGGIPHSGQMIEHDAKLNGIPQSAVDVEALGEVVIAIRSSIEKGKPQHVEIPASFDTLIKVIRGAPDLPVRGIIPALAPYVRV